MQTILIQDDSKEKIKTLTDIAKELGIKVKLLTNRDVEDLCLINAINKGRTKEYVDKNDFIKELRK
jgi:hypothetical protein